MKAITIAKVIQQKMDDYLASIVDEDLRKRMKNSIVVTGGCITSMFLRERINDFDVYFKDVETVRLVAEYYLKLYMQENKPDIVPMLRYTYSMPQTVTIDDHKYTGHRIVYRLGKTEVEHWDNTYLLLENQVNPSTLERVEMYIKSKGFAVSDDNKTDPNEDTGEYRYFETVQDATAPGAYIDKQIGEPTDELSSEHQAKKYRPTFISSNAITLSNKVQLVLRFWGKPDKIHETYDFAHATNYWTYETGLVTNTRALEATLSRELVYTGSKYPLASIFRARKFIQREWSCHVGNLVKMALQLNEFDLHDVNVLEEQLTGVDAAYLYQVIAAVKAKRAEDKNFIFNAAYLCEIVDRIMGEKQVRG